MTAPRSLLTATVAALALAIAALTTASDVAARGRHGGHAAGHHLGHHQHRFHLQQLRHHRHQRQLFTRFTPCVVWTRQGWTNVCSNKSSLVGSAPR